MKYRFIDRSRVIRAARPRAVCLALTTACAATLAVACSSEPAPAASDAIGSTSQALASVRFGLAASATRGDIDGDGRADIALTGGAIPGTTSYTPWGSMPVAFSRGDGTFSVTNRAVPDFPIYATQYGASAVMGDFNGDGVADVALTGGFSPSPYAPWGSIPVAFSKRDGTFNVTNLAVSGFPVYATQTGVRPVAGDFDGDGRADIALAGGSGWSTLPVAFSNGNGTFRVTNSTIANFATYATQANNDVPVQLVAADFNGDGRTDLALTGGRIPGSNAPWGSVPVAFSNGDGTFNVTNYAVPDFPTYATQTGAMAVAGDFNGDGFGDIALVGGAWWGSIPVAFSNGNGTFRVTNIAAPAFATYATQDAQVVAGDFDGDGRADLALTGGGIPAACAPWGSLPVAFSNGDGSFRVTNSAIATFGTYAAQSGPMAVSASQARPTYRRSICEIPLLHTIPIGELPCPTCCPYWSVRGY